MAFEFTCPFCLSRMQVSEEFLGMSGPCAECGRPVVMPTRDAERRLVMAVQTGKASRQETLGETSGRGDKADRALLRAIVGISGVLLATMLIASLFVGMPALRRQMKIADRNNDLTRMKAIATALNAYCDRYGTYPPPSLVDPTGKPLLSWRVLILPFLGHKDLYDEFALDQPWNSPLNMSLMQRMPEVFCSSNSPDAYGTKQPNFVLLTGNATVFPPSGPLGRTQVTDSPTLLLVETGNGIVAWTEPGDIDVSVSGARFGSVSMESIGGLHAEVALGVDTRGNAMILSKTTTIAELDALVSPNGGEAIASKDWTAHP
jgi:hypothetical protein